MPARAKGGERDERKRNIKTNFTRRDLLGIFGEDQDVGTSELTNVDDGECINEAERPNNTVEMHEWYIDTASNIHVVGDKRYFIGYIELWIDEATVRGVAPSFQEQLVGVGTIVLETFIEGKTDHTVIDELLLVPSAINSILSMERALDNKFKFKWDANTHRFTMLKNNKAVAQADKVGAVWVFHLTVASL